MNTYTTKAVGVSFENRQYKIRQLDLSQDLWVKPEPDNKYDSNAIAIVSDNGESLGYISRQEAAKLNFSEPVKCSRWSRHGGGKGRNIGISISFICP